MLGHQKFLRGFFLILYFAFREFFGKFRVLPELTAFGLGFFATAVGVLLWLFAATDAFAGEPGIEGRPEVIQTPYAPVPVVVSPVPQAPQHHPSWLTDPEPLSPPPDHPLFLGNNEGTLLPPPPPRFEERTIVVCRVCCRRRCCCFNVLDECAEKVGDIFESIGDCVEDGYDCISEKSCKMRECLAPKKRFCFFVSNIADGISQPFIATKKACSGICDEEKPEPEECGFFERAGQVADMGETTLICLYRAPVGFLTYPPRRLCSGPLAE